MVGKKYERHEMNESSYEAATALVSKTYVSQGRDAKRSHEKHIQMLIEQVHKIYKAPYIHKYLPLLHVA